MEQVALHVPVQISVYSRETLDFTIYQVGTSGKGQIRVPKNAYFLHVSIDSLDPRSLPSHFHPGDFVFLAQHHSLAAYITFHVRKRKISYTPPYLHTLRRPIEPYSTEFPLLR